MALPTATASSRDIDSNNLMPREGSFGCRRTSTYIRRERIHDRGFHVVCMYTPKAPRSSTGVSWKPLPLTCTSMSAPAAAADDDDDDDDEGAAAAGPWASEGGGAEGSRSTSWKPPRGSAPRLLKASSFDGVAALPSHESFAFLQASSSPINLPEPCLSTGDGGGSEEAGASLAPPQHPPQGPLPEPQAPTPPCGAHSIQLQLSSSAARCLKLSTTEEELAPETEVALPPPPMWRKARLRSCDASATRPPRLRMMRVMNCPMRWTSPLPAMRS